MFYINLNKHSCAFAWNAIKRPVIADFHSTSTSFQRLRKKIEDEITTRKFENTPPFRAHTCGFGSYNYS